MSPKANVERASMPYTRGWGHCSSRLQSITQVMPLELIKQLVGAGAKSALSQHPQWPWPWSLSRLLPTWIMGTQPPVPLSLPHCMDSLPPLERQAHAQKSGTLL